MALTRVVVGAPTGWLVIQIGWEWYYIVSVLAAAPGLLLLLGYSRWTGEADIRSCAAGR
jgi:PAT family beta-lactamase induction signal transducer AmpG